MKSEITCRHPYENWKTVTEADFVTLFIKTWFAFVSTLRELYADKAKPYYEASGDSPFLKPYKEEFADKFFFLCPKFAEIGQPLYDAYKAGLKIISEKYPRFLEKDFYNINQAFADKIEENFSGPGGYSGTLSLSVKCVSSEFIKVVLHYDDKKFLEKTKENYVLIDEKIDYREIIDGFIDELEKSSRTVEEEDLLSFFYDRLFRSVGDVLINSLANKQNALPDKGYSQVKQTFSAMQGFCSKKVDFMRTSCMEERNGAEHKLLAQMPIQGFLRNTGKLTSVSEQYAYVWFIGFVYRLRNALFHEIIDPLDTMWQLLFKNAYLVLKQIVDVNITRLQNISGFKEKAFSAYKDAFIKAPPQNIPIDDDTTFSDDSVELQCYNQTEAKVHIASTIECVGKSYHVECDVIGDKEFKLPKVKHVQITEQQQEVSAT